MAVLIVVSRVLRLALVVWLGLSALAWGVIFAMIELFETVRRQLIGENRSTHARYSK
jgi:hypothetical protein